MCACTYLERFLGGPFGKTPLAIETNHPTDQVCKFFDNIGVIMMPAQETLVVGVHRHVFFSCVSVQCGFQDCIDFRAGSKCWWGGGTGT